MSGKQQWRLDASAIKCKDIENQEEGLSNTLDQVANGRYPLYSHT